MTIEALARTIAKARHGTDAHWANYVEAAKAAQREVVAACQAIVKSETDSICSGAFGMFSPSAAGRKINAALGAIVE